jgi:hypothetical protein
MIYGLTQSNAVLRAFRFYEGNTFGGYKIAKADAYYKHGNRFGHVYKIRLELVSHDRNPDYRTLKKRMERSDGRFYGYDGQPSHCAKYKCFWDKYNVSERSNNDRSVSVVIKTTVM